MAHPVRHFSSRGKARVFRALGCVCSVVYRSVWIIEISLSNVAVEQRLSAHRRRWLRFPFWGTPTRPTPQDQQEKLT